MEGFINDLLSFDVQVPGVLLKIAIAAIIVLLGFILGKLLGRLVKRALHEAEVDNILKKIGLKLSLENALSILTRYFIYIISITMALNQLGVTTAVLQLILGGIIILIVLFAFIALKDFVPNAIAGFFIYRKQLIKKGDVIKVHNISGKVENVGLVETEVIIKSKDKLYIPNLNIIRSELLVKKKKK